MVARRKPPPQFRYLDPEIAESYLASLTGGLPEGSSTTERANVIERSVYNVGTRGTGAGGGRDTEDGSENQERYRYPPEAIFRFLYEELDAETEEGKILIPLDRLDEESWQELEDRNIVEITGTIKIPDPLKAMEAMGTFKTWLPALERIGEFVGEGVEDIGIGQKERSMIDGLGDMKEVADSQDATVIVIEVINTPRYRFVAKLKKSLLRTSLMDIEGEAKILGTVQRKLKKGDPPIGFEQLIPGLDALRAFQGNQQPRPNRAARRGPQRRRKPQGSDGNSISYPAATFTPIGIY
ncbi:MAG: hypothetical protein AVDCRST_MAG28-1769 [uncultured Rubrobacteraceae bacterium]|uniref:Uncharacterized protein n=1 Tax=uncultured Rubrobacteraceae bacterium TaxID=349277 RepID=A0A6J4QDP9_9ACTN|nr:MAG: hypothetical protein AVDCRST_MAG28-1769 [uncultured Rubrobacteraceae bacterium]